MGVIIKNGQTYGVIDTSNLLPKTGGAVTGNVTTPVTEFTNSSLVTKSYVDAQIANITDYETEVFPNA